MAATHAHTHTPHTNTHHTHTHTPHKCVCVFVCVCVCVRERERERVLLKGFTLVIYYLHTEDISYRMRHVLTHIQFTNNSSLLYSIGVCVHVYLYTHKCKLLFHADEIIYQMWPGLTDTIAPHCIQTASPLQQLHVGWTEFVL